MHSILIMHHYCDSRTFPRRGSQLARAGLRCHVLIKDVLKTNQSPGFNNKERREAENLPHSSSSSSSFSSSGFICTEFQPEQKKNEPSSGPGDFAVHSGVIPPSMNGNLS